jgi:class 3 adenylate cyclase
MKCRKCRTENPEEVHQIMDGCFKILMAEIHKYEGTINQFTGDGVMALFGAPLAYEDHARRACQSALLVQKALVGYEKKIKKDHDTEFKMRMGLNSGPVIVGSIGDDLRMDYTAVGDTTNLAARMEITAKPGTILVSGNTHKLARDFFEFKPLGEFELKGKEKLQIASVIGRDFAFRILQTITGMEKDLKSYLQNLQGLEFIYEKRLFPELEYIFKHARLWATFITITAAPANL